MTSSTSSDAVIPFSLALLSFLSLTLFEAARDGITIVQRGGSTLHFIREAG